MFRKHPRIMLALSLTAAVLLLAGARLIAARTTPSDPTAATPLAEVVASIPDLGLARRRLRHSRALLALPYFSFARGLGRNGS